MVKKTILFLFLILSTPISLLAQTLSLTDVKSNLRIDPVTPGLAKPTFSWKLVSNKRNTMQTAYEIKVASNKKDLTSGKNLLWNSGKQTSEQSTYIPFEGPDPSSRNTYYWQVKVWDNHGNTSKSPIMQWKAGLSASDWEANWIRTPEPNADEQVVLFGKNIEIGKTIESAQLYITAQGVYEAEINGKPVGDQLLAPGWTTYHKRLQYQIYNVTDLLQKGDNALLVGVAEGWYKGPLLGVNHFYGNKVGLLAQLEISYKDGSKQTILTDNSWKYSLEGPVIRSGLYSGEIYDARKKEILKTPNLSNQTLWKQVVPDEKSDYNHLVYSIAPPIRRQEVIKPQQIIMTPNGEKVIDFGQNLIGRARFSVKGAKGDSILLSHAEVLDKAGNFYTTNLRSAKQQILYYLAGGKEEFYEPEFTFQGFRYVRVEGNKELIDLDNIEAIVIHSDLEQTGTFTTSNPLLNQLQHNILWGQKSNFLDVPTDCPQRDERLGWTGDAQVFFATATFNMDVSGFFTKWMADLRADQREDGAITGIVPNIWHIQANEVGVAGWADAGTIIPIQYYKTYGEKQILEDSYQSMLDWADYIQSRSTNHVWDRSWHHGDWLHFMPQNVWDHAPAYTDKSVLAQCFYAHTLQNIIETAEILNKKEDVQKYTQLLQIVKDAFVREFVTPAGAIMSNTQTAYVLALAFDLLPENMRNQAAARLVGLVSQYGDHISTGFLGTPHICHVLSRFGYQDVAYRLLLQESFPSWLYPVKMGATTIWERWDGIRPDGTFQDEAMNSFNHYAYGAIGDWMYKNIAGLNQKENSTGYKNIIIAPRPGENLTESFLEFESVHGTIISSWKIEGNQMTLQVEIPANTNAEIIFPDIRKGEIKESGKTIKTENNQNKYNIGSGTYNFSFEI